MQLVYTVLHSLCTYLCYIHTLVYMHVQIREMWLHCVHDIRHVTVVLLARGPLGA